MGAFETPRGFSHTKRASYTHTCTYFHLFPTDMGCFTKPLYRGSFASYIEPSTYRPGFVKSLGVLHIQRELCKAHRDFTHAVGALFIKWDLQKALIHRRLCKASQGIVHTYAHSIYFFPTGMEGVKYQKIFFCMNCMECTDLHSKVMFLTMHLHKAGVEGSSTNLCA